ncbi:MAG TPA: murein biosynthesis integral membrane protein MurJ, partial [Gammaproteobacteria bacterium]|nr:murein biosynthesis integral membrane protein MurJ [Gammaproteobacteria bacterium]
DAFVVAFRIPNLLRRFFAEGAFSQAFVPVISEYRSTRSAEETKALVDRVGGTLALVVFAVTAVGVAAAPIVVAVFAPGFLGDDGRFGLTVDMIRWTFPYLLFVSLTAFAGGILNSHRRFAVPAFTPVLLNLVLIGFAALIAPRLERPGIGLAVGVFVAGLVQLAFQAPFLHRMRLLPRPRWAWRDAAVRRVLALMLPAVLGSSVAQINLLIDNQIATFLPSHSISWLYYSDRLLEFPLGVIGIALGTVILPRLSEHHARGSADAFACTIDWALRLVLVVALPAALGLAMLARPLLATIFFGGEFTQADVTMTTASLQAFAPGLLGFVLVKVLAPAYFARQDARTPVKIAVGALVLNTALSIALVVVLPRTGWAPPHAGLAFATTASGLLNGALLLAGLVRARIYRPLRGWRPLLLQVAAGCVVMAAFLALALERGGDWLEWSKADQVPRLATLVVVAASIYFVTCYALGLRVDAVRVAARKPS